MTIKRLLESDDGSIIVEREYEHGTFSRFTHAQLMEYVAWLERQKALALLIELREFPS